MKKLISAFAPSVPVWSVFVDSEGGIFTTPIEVIAMVEDEDSSKYGPYLEYWTAGYDGWFSCEGDNSNHIGYSYESNPPVESFQDDIDRYLRRQKDDLR